MFPWQKQRYSIMGVLNVTPDSFSDGGKFLDHERAIKHGLTLWEQGVDIIDVGGESTRPGADAVLESVELERVIPVIKAFVQSGVTVSVDTSKAAVASEALAAGALVVNDVQAGRDPEMFSTVAQTDVAYILMHMRGDPRSMQKNPTYDDVVKEVGNELHSKLEAAKAAGIAPERLLADPGIGFGKTVDHNLKLLAGIPQLITRLCVPIVIGTSRKSFIGSVLADSTAPPLGPQEREEGTLATTVWAFDAGAAIVRVHDVASAVAARRIVEQGVAA